MSIENTRPIICDFAAFRPQLQICTLDNLGRIMPTGMNTILRKAKGDNIIIRLQ
jgi:hypothetical protein